MFEKNTLSCKDTHLDDIMSYNDILDYVERGNNNKDGDCCWNINSSTTSNTLNILWTPNAHEARRLPF